MKQNKRNIPNVLNYVYFFLLINVTSRYIGYTAALCSHNTQKTSLFYSLFQAPAEVFLHDGIVPIPLGHASLCYADIIL